MAISTQITRIINDKTIIKNKLINLGLADNTANLDTLATEINKIENNGAVQASVKEGESYTIPKGYHSGAGVVQGVAGGGNYSLQEKTTTPTKAQQQITSDSGFYGLSSVTVEAIPEAYQDVSAVTAAAGDVLAPKVFVTSAGEAVTGTMANRGTVTESLYIGKTSYTIQAGKHSGSGKVSITTEEKSATPTTASQNITPTSGKVLSKVTVNAIPSKYGDATNATVTSGALLNGIKAIGISNGAAVTITGNMANRGAVTGTITGLGAADGDTVYTIPAGYHNGSGTVSITDDIETMLAEI